MTMTMMIFLVTSLAETIHQPKLYPKAKLKLKIIHKILKKKKNKKTKMTKTKVVTSYFQVMKTMKLTIQMTTWNISIIIFRNLKKILIQ